MAVLEEALVRITQLEKENTNLKNIIVEQDAELQSVKLQIDELKKENAELRARLQELLEIQNSPRRFQSRKDENKEKKSRGRESGFEGTSRLKPKNVDEVVDNLELKKCNICGNKVEIVEIRERIVEEIVRPRLLVKKYMIPRGYCRHCKKIVETKPVDVLPNSRFGLKFGLFVTALRSKGITLGKINGILSMCYSIKLTKKTICDTTEKVAKYLGPVYEEFIDEIRNSPSVNADETPWNMDGNNWWNWVFKTIDTVIYKITDNRSSDTPESILTDSFDGVLGTDGFIAYDKLKCKRQQCWVHIIRRLDEILERKPPPTQEFVRFAEKLKKIEKRAVDIWKQKLPEEIRIENRHKSEKKIMDLCSMTYTDNKCKTFVKFLNKHKHELFTFLEYEGVDWHNNSAERAIRPSVIIRKNTYGNRSPEGIRTQEIIMSVAETCKLRNEEFMSWGTEYFTNVLGDQLQKPK